MVFKIPQKRDIYKQDVTIVTAEREGVKGLGRLKWTPPAGAMMVISEKERGLPEGPAWATEPPIWGEPIGNRHLLKQLQEIDRKKVYRYAYPNGKEYETEWESEAAAKAWGRENGHRYLGEVRLEPTVERAPRDIGSRGTEPDLSPPPLIQAPVREKLNNRKPKPQPSRLPIVAARPGSASSASSDKNEVGREIGTERKAIESKGINDEVPTTPGENEGNLLDFMWSVIRQINPFESRERRIEKVEDALKRNGFENERARKEAEKLIRHSGEIGEFVGGALASRYLAGPIRRLFVREGFIPLGPIKQPKKRPDWIGPRRPNNPRPTVQAGHIASKELREAGLAEERLALEDSTFNEALSGNIIESKGAYSLKDTISIGGIPVERRTALLYARQSRSPNFPSPSEVLNAPSVPGRLAPSGIKDTEKEFMRWARNIILSEGDQHPLRFLLE
jgi:hypothetical protein